MADMLRGALRVVTIAFLVASCSASQVPAPPRAAVADAPDATSIALPHEAPKGQVVSWTSGPFVFVVDYDVMIAALDGPLRAVPRYAPLRGILHANANNPDLDIFSLNDVADHNSELAAVVPLLVAAVLESGNASLIDMEHGFVVKSVKRVPFSANGHSALRFETRDGRPVLEVVDFSPSRAPLQGV